MLFENDVLDSSKESPGNVFHPTSFKLTISDNR